VLDLAAHELPSQVDDSARAVDVSPLERHQLGRANAGRRSEDDHRPRHAPKL
jgi:hypothetical protein